MGILISLVRLMYSSKPLSFSSDWLTACWLSLSSVWTLFNFISVSVIRHHAGGEREEFLPREELGRRTTRGRHLQEAQLILQHPSSQLLLQAWGQHRETSLIIVVTHLDWNRSNKLFIDFLLHWKWIEIVKTFIIVWIENKMKWVHYIKSSLFNINLTGL